MGEPQQTTSSSIEATEDKERKNQNRFCAPCSAISQLHSFSRELLVRSYKAISHSISIRLVAASPRCVLLRAFNSFIPILVFLVFMGALLWAKEEDAVSRKWFTLKTPEDGSFKCVAVLPKPVRYYPVVIYAHGAGGTLMNDGNDLRQMAELGLAVVSLEYNQTNENAFVAQFGTLLEYLSQQSWANVNAVAWTGFGLGADRIFDFALQHTERQPRLLIQLSGTGLAEGQAIRRLQSLHCPVLLIHGEQDETFPATDTKRLAASLQSNGLPVKLKIIHGLPNSMEPQRGVVFRNIGEYCLTRLVGKDAWQNYHSIAQWQAEASPLWRFWLPAVVWMIGWFGCARYRKTASPSRIKLTRGGIALRVLAVVTTMWAVAETSLHLVTPHFSINAMALSIARRFLVQPEESADFEYLAKQPIWQGNKLKTLLDHAELSAYNRELINWHLEDKVYRDFVLFPVITGDSSEQFNWRRQLWEEFYPRIRHESTLEDAARIVVRHLRERVTIASFPNLPCNVPNIWLRQITDEAGFDIIYVASLRSVGVPARLGSNDQAEFWDGTKWQFAPEPDQLH
jgi:dienelactone hydrolase